LMELESISQIQGCRVEQLERSMAEVMESPMHHAVAKIDQMVERESQIMDQIAQMMEMDEWCAIQITEGAENAELQDTQIENMSQQMERTQQRVNSLEEEMRNSVEVLSSKVERWIERQTDAEQAGEQATAQLQSLKTVIQAHSEQMSLQDEAVSRLSRRVSDDSASHLAANSQTHDNLAQKATSIELKMQTFEAFACNGNMAYEKMQHMEAELLSIQDSVNSSRQDTERRILQLEVGIQDATECSSTHTHTAIRLQRTEQHLLERDEQLGVQEKLLSKQMQLLTQLEERLSETRHVQQQVADIQYTVAKWGNFREEVVHKAEIDRLEDAMQSHDTKIARVEETVSHMFVALGYMETALES